MYYHIIHTLLFSVEITQSHSEIVLVLKIGTLLLS